MALRPNSPEHSKGATFINESTGSITPSEYDILLNSEEMSIYLDDSWIPISKTDKGYGFVANIGTSIQRLSFPFDSGILKFVGTNSIIMNYATGLNSSQHGFVCGGQGSGGTTESRSYIRRFEFPFDSGTSEFTGNLSQSNGYGLSGCNSSQHGYVFGGSQGSSIFSTVNRLTFPFNSGTASQVGNLSRSRQYISACNSSQYGFSMGGGVGGVGYSEIERLTFPFDSGTASNIGYIPISISRYQGGCNSSSHGYCIGGDTSGAISNISRLTFPFNSGTASQVGYLSEGKGKVASFNSSSHGFIGGFASTGTTFYFTSSIDRIEFPFDSGTASQVGNLNDYGLFNPISLCGIDTTDFINQFI